MSKESGDGGGGDKPPINELKTRMLEAISAHRTPALEEFKDFAGEKTIKSDERYVRECKKEFE